MTSFRNLIGHQLTKLYAQSDLEKHDFNDALAKLNKISAHNYNLIVLSNLLVQINYMDESGYKLSINQANNTYMKILHLLSIDDDLSKTLCVITLNSLAFKTTNALFGTHTLNSLLIDKNKVIQSHSLFTLQSIKTLDFNYIKSNLRFCLLSDNDIVIESALILIKKISLLDPLFCIDWISDIADIAKKSNSIKQSLALDTLFHMKKTDTNYLVKILIDCSSKSSDMHASCGLIRLVNHIIKFCNSSQINSLTKILHQMLSSIRFSVATEATSVILKNRKYFGSLIKPSLSHLAVLSSSSSSTNRFVCAKILCQFLFSGLILESDQPIINKSNEILSKLVMDKSQTVSILSLSGYLKSSSISPETKEEEAVKIIEKITQHYSTMNLEYKIGIISAFKTLASRFPGLISLLVLKLKTWLLDCNEIISIEQKEKVENLISSTLIHFCSQKIDSDIKLNIIQILATFISDSHNEKGICDIIESFSLFSLDEKCVHKAITLTCIEFANLSLSKKVKECALNTLLHIGLDSNDLNTHILNYLKKFKKIEQLSFSSRANLFYNIIDSNLPSFDRSNSLSNHYYDLSPLICKLDNYLNDDSDMSDFNIETISIEKNKVLNDSLNKSLNDDNIFKPINKNIHNSSENENLKFIDVIKESLNDIKEHLKITEFVNLNEKSNEIFAKYSKIIFENYIIFRIQLENTVSEMSMTNLNFKFISLPKNTEIKYYSSITNLKPNIEEQFFFALKFNNFLDLFEGSLEFSIEFNIQEINIKPEINIENEIPEEVNFPEIEFALSDILTENSITRESFFDTFENMISKYYLCTGKMAINSTFPQVRSMILNLLSCMSYIYDLNFDEQSKEQVLLFSAKTISNDIVLIEFNLKEEFKTISVESRIISENKNISELVKAEIFC